MQTSLHGVNTCISPYFVDHVISFFECFKLTVTCVCVFVTEKLSTLVIRLTIIWVDSEHNSQPLRTLSQCSGLHQFARRQRESCTTSVSVCSSHYIHSAAPSHQLWRAFTWVDRWLSWGSTAPNRGALTCQLSVRPQNQLCHVISSTPITVTHQVCVRKQRRRLHFNTTLPWANRKKQAIIMRQVIM